MVINTDSQPQLKRDDGMPSTAFVLAKLMFYSFLMIACPLGSFWLAWNRELDGTQTSRPRRKKEKKPPSPRATSRSSLID
jgi:hypothetical protein